MRLPQLLIAVFVATACAGPAPWRDFFDAGLHVASAVDTPWMFPDFQISHDIGRPVDQIAGGMDGWGRINDETPGSSTSC